MKFNKFSLLLLFVILFVLDKLILIPPVKNLLTDEVVGNPYIETLNNASGKYMEDAKYQDKKKIWAFGTSRSFGFYQFSTPIYNRNSSYISESQKKTLDAYKIFAFAAPGSNPLIYYTRFNQLLDQNLKPDIVFLELSAFSFNKNNRFYNIILLEGMPLDFAIKYFNELPSNFAKEYFFSRLFSLSRYKLSSKAVSTHLFGSKDKNTELLKSFISSNAMTGDPFANLFETKEIKEEVEYSPDKFNDFQGKPATETDTYLKTIMMVDVLKKEFYGNFTHNKDNYEFLKQILVRCKKRNIPVVLWVPKVHKNLADYYESASFYPQWKSKIMEVAAETNSTFLDLNEPTKVRCDYFQDAAHHSGRCLPEVTTLLLESLNKK